MLEDAQNVSIEHAAAWLSRQALRFYSCPEQASTLVQCTISTYADRYGPSDNTLDRLVLFSLMLGLYRQACIVVQKSRQE